MASKTQQIEWLKKDLKSKGDRIRSLENGLFETTKALDAILYEVCMKYGNETQHSIEIPVPKVDLNGFQKISVEKTEGAYVITPVQVTEDGK